MSASELLDGLRLFNPKGWRPVSALLRALGVAIPLVLGFGFHQPAGGVLAAIGALYTGTASFGGIQPVRVQRMIAASLLTAIITGIACFLNRSEIATILGVSCFAFLFAVIGSIGPGANIVAVQAMGALIVVSGIPQSGNDPVGNCLLVLGGGLIQTVLLSFFGPINPYSVEREAVAAMFSELESFVRSQTTEKPDEIPDAEPFQEAITRLDEANYYGAHASHLPMQHATSVAETIRAALVGYARAFKRALNENASEELLATNDHLADSLATVAERIRAGENPTSWPPERFDISASEGDLRYWLDLIDCEFEELRSQDTDAPPPPRGSWFPRLQNATGLLESKSLKGVVGAHALRYAVAIGASCVAAAYYRTDHAYWLPLTVAFVLRSDFASTLSRGLGRALGTIAGVAFATAIDALLHPPMLVMVAAVVAATWLAYAVFQANYTAYAFALTLFVVFAISGAGLPEREVGIERVIATLLGIVVALGTAFLWPLWQSNELRGVLKDAFDSQAAYGRIVERTLLGENVGRAPEVLRRRARAIRIDAQRLSQAAKYEPTWGRRTKLDATEDLGFLARGAAEMLFVHAQAVNGHGSLLGRKEELLKVVRAATARAERMSLEV